MYPGDIEGLDMNPATEPVFFWALGENRRVVVAEWGQLKVLGQRVFRRFVGGKGRWITSGPRCMTF
jgi:hypothetical protein